MLRNHQIRCTTSVLLTGMLLIFSVGPSVQVASAQCADPRGNAYCTNGGLATGQNPNPPMNVGQNPNPPKNVGQNPNPGGLVGQNPNPGGLVGQNPNPGGLVGQNPNPGGLVGQNPNPGTPVAQNTSAPPAQSQAPQSSQASDSSSRPWANGSVTVDPPGAPAGATVTVSVAGLPANSAFVVNLGQLKTAAGQIYGAENMPTADGASMQADSNGNFSGTFTVPAVPDFINPQGSVCAVILGRASYCAPFALQSVGLGADGEPSVAPAAGAVDGTGTTFCYSCQVLTNDDARRYGSYNSGSGQYEYHGAQP
jgi:hypothetical protein